MKRRGLIAALVVLMVMMSTAFCFADDDALKIESSYPENGQKNTSIENVGVKVNFNHSIDSKEALATNKKCVKIVDQNGKAIATKVIASDKVLLVLADNTEGKIRFDNNADYTLVMSADLVDNDGHTLGAEQQITFRTFNQRMNNIINMVMMFVMFGGIMFMTLKSQKEQQEQKEAAKTAQDTKKDAVFNPYKEAKKTGKSVKEVIAEEEKRQAKEAKKAAKKNKNKAPEVDVKLGNLSEILPYVYHVSEPKPISAAGGKTLSGKGVKKEAPASKKSSNVKRGTGKRVK